MEKEETIDFHIRWAWCRIAKMYDREAAKYNGTMASGYVLLNIDPEKGTPSTKLGPMMGMEPRSLTRVLRTLEEHGLICREQDEQDKRKVNICLTKNGHDRRLISRDTVIGFNEKLQARLTKREVGQFISIMTKINNILDNEKIFNDHEENN